MKLFHSTWVADPTQTFSIKSSGASGSATFSLVSGPGSIDPLSGLFTPGSAWGTSVVRISDSLGRSKDANITQIPTWMWTNGTVNAVAFDGLGSVFIGGNFTQVGTQFPAPRMLAMDLSTGDPRPECDLQSGFNGDVTSILTTESAIFVGGDFTEYRGVSAQRLAKLDLNCQLDTLFTQNLGFDNGVVSLAAHTQGNALYAGGSFTSYRGVTNSAQGLAKLDLTTGNLDTVFTKSNSGFLSSAPQALAVHVANNSLYVGGPFTTYRGVANSAQSLAKLDLATGDLDTVFTKASSGFGGGFQYGVAAIAIHSSSNSLYVGGDFTQYRGVAGNAQRLAKVDLTTGNLDTVFTKPSSGFSGGFSSDAPRSIAIHAPTNSIYIGGDFQSYRGVANSAPGLAKLDLSSGNLDTIFTQNNNALPLPGALALKTHPPSHSIYVAGNFTQYRGVANNARYLAKLDLTTGNLDTSFTRANRGFESRVLALEIHSSSSTLLSGGAFSQYRGTNDSINYLAKINLATGNLDTNFTQPNNVFATYTNGGVEALAIHASNNSLYAGGLFTQYRGVANSAQSLAKLDLTSGNLDTSFSQVASGFNGRVEALAIHASNNSLYVGGGFTQYRGLANSAQSLAKLNLDTGNLDTVFTQNNNGLVDCSLFPIKDLAIHSANNSLYIASGCTKYRGVANNTRALAKVDLTTGNLDTTFTKPNNGFNDYAVSLAIHADTNSLFVGGRFVQYRGVANSALGLAKLDLTTGDLDTVFTQKNNGLGGNWPVIPWALRVLPSSNSLYIGGQFSSYRGSNVQNLAKVDLTSGNLDTNFTKSGSGIGGGTYGIVNTLGLHSSNSTLFLGGDFTLYRGEGLRSQYTLQVDPSTGNPK